MGKSVDLLVSEFFLRSDLSVIMFSSKGNGCQCKFHFDSMYGGLDAAYGSNMKIDKEGSLAVRIT